MGDSSGSEEFFNAEEFTPVMGSKSYKGVDDSKSCADVCKLKKRMSQTCRLCVCTYGTCFEPSLSDRSVSQMTALPSPVSTIEFFVREFQDSLKLSHAKYADMSSISGYESRERPHHSALDIKEAVQENPKCWCGSEKQNGIIQRKKLNYSQTRSSLMLPDIK